MLVLVKQSCSRRSIRCAHSSVCALLDQMRVVTWCGIGAVVGANLSHVKNVRTFGLWTSAVLAVVGITLLALPVSLAPSAVAVSYTHLDVYKRQLAPIIFCSFSYVLVCATLLFLIRLFMFWFILCKYNSISSVETRILFSSQQTPLCDWKY